MCPWENAPPKSSEVKAKTKSLSGIFFTLSLIGNGEALGLTRLGSGLGVRFRKVADSLHILMLYFMHEITSLPHTFGQARHVSLPHFPAAAAVALLWSSGMRMKDGTCVDHGPGQVWLLAGLWELPVFFQKGANPVRTHWVLKLGCLAGDRRTVWSSFLL